MGTGARAEMAVLLSTYNGEKFLREQLESLFLQTYRDWILLWRDDGSIDGTKRIMQEFVARTGSSQCQEVRTISERLGPTQSFFQLMCMAQDHPMLAFMDQDDVWLPEKLDRAVRWIKKQPEDIPALYCGRQTLVDSSLRILRRSPQHRRLGGFPSALIQNIATGCTIVMNRKAAQAVVSATLPRCSVHDWWSYIVVAALNGAIYSDEVPMILYRQHSANAIGAPTRLKRALGAIRRDPQAFYTTLRAHLESLDSLSSRLPSGSVAALKEIDEALRAGPLARAGLIFRGVLTRQTFLENMLTAYWLMRGG